MTENIKLEPLPWFAFNVADYQTGTGRLPTESHGAYLLLMLDYYGKASPCPDDDFILAAVTRLPVETWKKHRKILEPFFDVRDGHWFHERIEHELLEACSKHAARCEKARNAALAKHEKRREERGIPAETPAKRPRSARSMLQAATEHAPSVLETCSSPTQTQTQTHNTTPYSRSISDDATTKASDQVLEDQVGIPVPPQFQPSEEGLARCDADGASAAEIDEQVRLFIAYNDDRGSFSTDWNKTWTLWWARHMARRAKEAPPRVEVNNTRPEPTEAELSRSLANFARGIPWPYRSMGPEPGQLGCRVPPALIEKHGIDPKTGLKRRTEPVT